MANEESTNSKDFIVVGGKRRWFSVPDKDERFSESPPQSFNQKHRVISLGLMASGMAAMRSGRAC